MIEHSKQIGNFKIEKGTNETLGCYFVKLSNLLGTVKVLNFDTSEEAYQKYLEINSKEDFLFEELIAN